MGYYVISFCEVSLQRAIEEPLKKKIRSLLEEVGATDIKFSKFFINFELGGNKDVDYDVLDKIKELLLKDLVNKKCNFQITANEFVESDSVGYYFDSEDDEE